MNRKYKKKKNVITDICITSSLLIISITLIGLIVFKQKDYFKIIKQSSEITKIDLLASQLKDGEETLLKINSKVNKIIDNNNSVKNEINSMDKYLISITKKIEMIEKGV